jgi:hypothetical protein
VGSGRFPRARPGTHRGFTPIRTSPFQGGRDLVESDSPIRSWCMNSPDTPMSLASPAFHGQTLRALGRSGGRALWPGEGAAPRRARPGPQRPRGPAPGGRIRLATPRPRPARGEPGLGPQSDASCGGPATAAGRAARGGAKAEHPSRGRARALNCAPASPGGRRTRRGLGRAGWSRRRLEPAGIPAPAAAAAASPDRGSERARDLAVQPLAS